MHPPLPDRDWPELPPLAHWQDTFQTVHLWTQIVGKICLASTPLVNHWWNVTLHLSARGLSTRPLVDGAHTFQIDFDFVDHALCVTASDGGERSISLRPRSVADFYRRTTQALRELEIAAHIWPLPVEVPDPIQPFPEDETHASYDADAIGRFWRALVQAHRVFTDFRARFIGKVSPVHFFWGAFDLAVTRFSGRTAPLHPGGVPNCADWVMQEAYSHELSSAGFWPGAGLGEAAFYAYAYPEPEGFRTYDAEPAGTYFHPELGEFILPYEAVRTADDPEAALLRFLQSTYAAGADLGHWDREALERPAGYHPEGTKPSF